MKKLLAVLTVVGVFSFVVGAGVGSATVSKGIVLPSTVHCVAGVTTSLDNTTDEGGYDWVHILINKGYDAAAANGGYWETPHHIPWFGTPSPWQIDHFDLSFVTVTTGACAVPTAAAPEPARIAYCSVAGNSLPDGTPLVPGTFLNLLAGQAATDAHYTGATPAFWVEGVGLTCSLSPTQAALASASTTLVGGGGTPFPSGLGGIYTFIPSK